METNRRAFIAALAAASAGMAFPARRASATGALDDIDDLFNRATVFDALGMVGDNELSDSGWKVIERSGFTAIQTSLNNRNLAAALSDLSQWQGRFERYPNRLLKIIRADDILRAKREGKLGVMLGFQNATCIEDDDRFVAWGPTPTPDGLRAARNLKTLYAAGARCIQLTYNERNLLGDGCTERTNAGLSDFGVAVVETMNELGMVVDVSHCGERTSRDAIEISRKPPAFTHTMCSAVHDHPRAKSDDLLRAMANRGGMIGVVTLGYFVGPSPETTVEDYLNHVDHAVKVAGMEHVGVASDYSVRGIEATATRETWYEPRLKEFKPSYNVRWPPWIPELDQPDRFRTVARGLARRGYRPADIEAILGGNWVRYFREVIG